MTRLSIFDQYGYFIGDLRSNPSYEFVLNADPSPGRCEFTVSRNDPKCTLKYLEFGRIVLIRRSPLPDWVGVIVRRSRNYGSIDILALQAEHVLYKRNTPDLKFQGTAGSIFKQTLDFTNGNPFNEKPVFPNSIYVGGPNREESMGKRALSHIQQVAERSGNDFDVDYNLDTNGRLYLRGNWYERRGIITNKFLREGHNIELAQNLLVEDARDMANWFDGRGDASTKGKRVASLAYSEASIKRYGLNQEVEVFDGNKEQSTVDTNTLSRLKASLDPAKSWDITALDVGDTFDFLGIGNVHNMVINSSLMADETEEAFSTPVETLGMEIDSISNTARLIVQKYTPTEAEPQ